MQVMISMYRYKGGEPLSAGLACKQVERRTHTHSTDCVWVTHQPLTHSYYLKSLRPIYKGPQIHAMNSNRINFFGQGMASYKVQATLDLLLLRFRKWSAQVGWEERVGVGKYTEYGP